MKNKKSFKKEIIEWAIFLGIFGILFGTGLNAPVFGFLQGLILKTGIIQPSIDDDINVEAQYNFTLIDAKGNRIAFEDFKGKTLFINFWATWCPPCIAEMPDLSELYREMRDEDIEFVFISVDDDFDKAVRYVENKQFDIPIYRLATGVPEAFESRSLPTTYVVDPEGQIKLKKSGMAKYNTERFRNFLAGLSH